MHPSVQQLMLQVNGSVPPPKVMTAQEAGEALSKAIPGIKVVDPHAIPESGNAPVPTSTSPPPTGSVSPVPPAVPPAVNR
jgi:hypothetical protein